MTLDVYAAKPGTGKTYHFCATWAESCVDWCRYEIKNGVPFERKLVTNIPINAEGLKEYVSKRLGQKFDPSHYVEVLDDDFFRSTVYWWEQFPNGVLIAIDEVHQYLGQAKTYGDLDLEQALIEWLGTHRHRQQDIVFITQHQAQFNQSILGPAGKLIEIVNMKDLTAPWPLCVPLADLYTVKEAFGIKTQYYRCNTARYQGKRLVWEGASTQHLMRDEIFKIYKSHTLSSASSDRPDLKMSRFEAIIWFLRRHGWHLIPKALAVVLLPLIVYLIIAVLMPLGIGAVAESSQVPRVSTSTAQSQHVDIQEVTINRNDNLQQVEFERRYSALEQERAMEREKHEQELAALTEKVKRETEIVAIIGSTIILRNGNKVVVGDSVDFDGVTEIITGTDVLRGLIIFESGKTLKL